MKEVNLQSMSRRDAERAIEASYTVPTEEHAEGCPVKHRASADCVFPFAACVPDDFEERHPVE